MARGPCKNPKITRLLKVTDEELLDWALELASRHHKHESARLCNSLDIQRQHGRLSEILIQLRRSEKHGQQSEV